MRSKGDVSVIQSDTRLPPKRRDGGSGICRFVGTRSTHILTERKAASRQITVASRRDRVDPPAPATNHETTAVSPTNINSGWPGRYVIAHTRTRNADNVSSSSMFASGCLRNHSGARSCVVARTCSSDMKPLSGRRHMRCYMRQSGDVVRTALYLVRVR